jgi:hydroxymethylglutaryl-CoA reductase
LLSHTASHASTTEPTLLASASQRCQAARQRGGIPTNVYVTGEHVHGFDLLDDESEVPNLGKQPDLFEF